MTRGHATTASSRGALRVLMIDDSPDDAELVLRELQRGGYEPSFERVGSAAGLAAALEQEEWDVITCDYALPGFDALDALRLIRERGLDIPVIVVSGKADERTAIGVMDAGAHDFVSKHNLTRLCPAIERERRSAKLRLVSADGPPAAHPAEQRFRWLIENAFDLVAILDPDGRLRYVSGAIERVAGLQPDELIGTSVFDLIHPDDVALARERLADGIQRGESTGLGEYRIRHKDGSWRHVEGIIKNLLAEPAVRGILVSTRDVSARKRAEAALALQAQIIAQLRDALVTTDLDGMVISWNAGAQRLFGYREEEILGRDIAILYPEDEPPVRGRQLLASLEAGEDHAREARMRRQPGDEFRAQLSFSLLRDEGGAAIGMIAHASDVTEARQAEDALRRSEEKYRRIVETAQEGVWTFDTAGVTTFINQKISVMLGCVPEEVVGTSVFDFIDEGDRAVAMANLSSPRRGIAEHLEFRFRCKDGTDLPALVATSPIYDSEGRYDGALAMVTDLTTYKRALAALAGSEHRYRGLFEAAKDGIVVLDADAEEVIDVNPAFVELFGYSRQELVGARLQDDDGTYARAVANLRAIGQLDDGSSIRWDRLVLPTKDGTAVTVEVVGSLSRLDGRRVVQFTLRDVSRRERAEAALRESEERYRSVVSILNDGIVLQLASGEIAACNVAAERILGLTKEGMSGRTSHDPRWRAVREDGSPFPGEEHPAMVALRTGRPSSNVIMGVHRPSDDLVWISINTQPLFHEGEAKPYGVVTSFSDVTERKRADADIRKLHAELEERVRQRTRDLDAVNQELEAFSYSVSHDLRAPLRAIGSFNRILLEEHAERLDDEGRRILQRVQANAERMGRLIDDLLALSRVTQTALQRQPVNLSALAREIAAELRETEPARQVDFSIAPNLLVQGDPALLRVALENLLANAWKFTGKHATALIELGAARSARDLVYFVRDDGSGFDKRFAHRLFGAFQRLHSAADFEGSGIGLATVQRIVHRHGGRIWAEGAPEKGATFFFTLATSRRREV